VETFTYTISDGQGGAGQGLVSVTVVSANEAPIAVDDVFGGILENSASNTMAVLANDSDPDDDALTAFYPPFFRSNVHFVQ
jgi:hypothetical protein